MDLAAITARTGISTRRLRYVLDHRVLPGTDAAAAGRGVPRAFTPFEAFGVACAALLLDAGLTRRLTQACLAVAAGPTGPASPLDQRPLFRAYGATPASLEVGDGAYLRLRGGRPPARSAFDTGWLPLRPGASAAAGYRPLVLVRIDLAGLRGRIGE